MARSRLRSFWPVRAQNALSLPSFGASLPHFTVFSRLFFQRITIIFLPSSWLSLDRSLLASRCLQYDPVFFPTQRIVGTP
jgi:hypothetical protein